MIEVETFKPLGDRVALLEIKESETGGIILPMSYQGEDQRYKVIALSSKVEKDHGEAIKEGSEVIAVNRPGGHTVMLNGVGECRVMSYKDIKAVVS